MTCTDKKRKPRATDVGRGLQSGILRRRWWFHLLLALLLRLGEVLEKHPSDLEGVEANLLAVGGGDLERHASSVARMELPFEDGVSGRLVRFPSLTAKGTHDHAGLQLWNS